MFCAVVLFALSTPPVVTNWKGGETIHYPLVIIEGEAGGDAVTIEGNSFDVVDGRYVGVAELMLGSNTVKITDDAGKETELRLTFKEPKTEYRVRTWFVVAKDEPFLFEDGKGGYATDHVKRSDTMVKLIQSMTAEMMREAGYGRKTFAVELTDGKVDVQTAKYPESGEDLRAKDGNALWYKMYEWLAPQMDGAKIKNCLLAGYTRWDAETKTNGGGAALGGGYLGYFGTSSMFTWPTSPSEIANCFADATVIDTSLGLDDSAYRSTIWGSCSTTIGAVLHEMGHTFGLPHTNDPQGIMSRGFDFTNRWFVMTEPPSGRNKEPFTITPEQRPRWSKAWAAILNVSPWFQSEDATVPNSLGPKAELSEGTVTVASPTGLAVIVAHADGKDDWLWEVAPADSTKLKTLKVSDLRKTVGDGAFTVIALDMFGRRHDLPIPEVSKSV